MNAPAVHPGKPLCRIEEIEDGEAKGFVLGEGVDQISILVARDGEAVFGYLNVCPHTGSPLDWNEDEFMSEDGAHLMCHTHGALFRIGDGDCIAGPCAGDRLTPVPLEIDGEGRVLLRPR
ncbi:MAG: Rieske 2Fe-2S domain-containing protein [Rhodospirillales bacterium]|nr:Rieske 2Fe-2S domain-containing protein [Rhodospirillales bacterium]